MVEVKQLVDNDGEFYPVTAAEAVIFANGENLEEKEFVTEGVWSSGEGEGSAVLTDGGPNISATGAMSVAEGNGQAIGDFSHAEGGYPNDSGNDYVGGVAVGKGSHAEGRNTYAVGGLAHASGYGTSTEITYTSGSVSGTSLTLTPSEAITVNNILKIGDEYCNVTAVSVNDSAYTLTLDKSLTSFPASGSVYRIKGVAYGSTSFVGGQSNVASGNSSVAFGVGNVVSGTRSLVLGNNNVVSGANSFSNGANNVVSGGTAAAIGGANTVSASSSCAVGQNNNVSGGASTAIGLYNNASGTISLAQGYYCSATNQGAVAIGDLAHVFSSGSNNHGGIAIGYSWFGSWKPVGAANATSYTNTYYSADATDLENVSASLLGSMYVGSIITDLGSSVKYAKILTCTATKSGTDITWTFTTDKTLSDTALDGTKEYYISLTAANYWSFAFNGLALGGRSVAMGRGAMTTSSYAISIGNHTLAKSTNAECALGTYNASNSGTTFSVGIGNSTTRKNGIELNGGKFYVNGVGTYDGTNPVSGTNDLVSVLATKAETTDLSGKEDVANKVTSISSSSTDTQYPSAKCMYDIVGDVELALDVIINGSSS